MRDAVPSVFLLWLFLPHFIISKPGHMRSQTIRTHPCIFFPFLAQKIKNQSFEFIQSIVLSKHLVLLHPQPQPSNSGYASWRKPFLSPSHQWPSCHELQHKFLGHSFHEAGSRVECLQNWACKSSGRVMVDWKRFPPDPTSQQWDWGRSFPCFCPRKSLPCLLSQ